jgi:hypothetical protein
MSDGSVNREATDNARVARLSGGSLSIDNLREAVLMTALRTAVVKVQTRSQYYPLPAALTRAFTYTPRTSFSSGGSLSMSTAQTVLAWRWIPAHGEPIEGTLTWPDSSDPAEAHAVALLAVAERGLVEGCVSIAPPSSSGSGRARRTTGTSDAYQEWFDELDAAFTSAREKWSTIPRCR